MIRGLVSVCRALKLPRGVAFILQLVFLRLEGTLTFLWAVSFSFFFRFQGVDAFPLTNVPLFRFLPCLLALIVGRWLIQALL